MTAARRQHQERGLESILGVVLVVEDGPADAPDKSAVAVHESRERFLLAVNGEAGQQLGIAVVADGASHVTEIAEQQSGLCV